jgi:MFS family permease
MLVVLGGVGLARFAFGMILPAMAADLKLDYSQQGFLGASYFVGYLAIVVVMPWLAPKAGCRRLCIVGLALVTVSLVALSQGRDYLFLSASYFVTGVGSGALFIGAMTLASFWFHPSHRARGAGVVTAGAGVGILISGILVPQVSGGLGMAPWQLIWLIFAGMSAVFCLLAVMFLRNRPAELGLTAYGRPENNRDKDHTQAGAAHGGVERPWPAILHMGIAYTLFAVTMMTYTTFIVTTMVDTLAVTPATAGLLWAAVGGLSIFSGSLFGAISDKLGYRAGMVSALMAQAVAYSLIAAGTGAPGLYASVILFGISAWSMPTIVAAATGDYLGPEKAAAGFAVLTLMFAVGQTLGPAGAGVLATWTGGFAIAFAFAVGLNLLAAALCLFLRPPVSENN